MPEYLAPGVYVEETSFRSKPIEGVNTSTAGFVGPTLLGPVDRASEAITSVRQFEQLYGGLNDLPFGPNYLAHAVRAYFENGGQRLFVARTPIESNMAPGQAAYETALSHLTKIDSISTVAGPGYSSYPEYDGIQQSLIAHAEARGAYRFAVLDTPPAQTTADVREARSKIGSKFAALYYPWVVAANPLAATGQPPEILLPPSGFICGIYARNDIERGVHKAPANEVVRGVLRLERAINKAEQELLNPIGINCLRYFEGRGYLVWGARTTSADPEWKYVNVRRYFNYLEASIDRGIQWAVLEPNGEPLWARVRQSIGDFLFNEWRNGALLGTKAEEVYFVRCDRSTMTQNDLDNGRLVCLIGVTILKPAEFVIFRIGQKTADAQT